MKQDKKKFKKMGTVSSRRGFFHRSIYTAGGLGVTATTPGLVKNIHAQQGMPNEPKFLINVAAQGGGSLIDSVLPILPSETNNPNLITYAPELIAEVAGSSFRCVEPIPGNQIQNVYPLGNNYPIKTFLQKHGQDMVVMAQECTSVNHDVAARRAMNGDHINGGMTISETVAQAYGEKHVLANCVMAGGGYGEHGTAPNTPDYALGVKIADPLLFALGLHSSKGVSTRFSRGEWDLIRQVRYQTEVSSGFGKTFGEVDNLKRYVTRRERLIPELEKGDYIDKLMLMQNQGNINLEKFGLQSSGDLALVLETFPNIATDDFEAQAALAFLLIRHGLSVAVTIAPNPLVVFDGANRVISPPIAFDYSHTEHLGAQNAMWSRMFYIMDGLISLLKKTQIPGLEKSFWDNTLMYLPTEFGRDKELNGPDSGHNLNNGNILVSPLLKGNKFYGGLDFSTGLTHGFNRDSGEPDATARMKEGDVFSVVAQALGITFEGQRKINSMVKT